MTKQKEEVVPGRWEGTLSMSEGAEASNHFRSPEVMEEEVTEEEKGPRTKGIDDARVRFEHCLPLPYCHQGIMALKLLKGEGF